MSDMTFDDLLPYWKVVSFKLERSKYAGTYLKLLVPKKIKNSMLLSIARKHRKKNGLYLSECSHTIDANNNHRFYVSDKEKAVKALLADLRDRGISAVEYDKVFPYTIGTII